MKKFFVLLTLAAFLVSATMTMAQDTPKKEPSAKPGQTINCCVKGECKQVAGEADCTKAGGKVLKECKDCK